MAGSKELQRLDEQFGDILTDMLADVTGLRPRPPNPVFRGIEHLRSDDAYADFAADQLRVIDREQGVFVPFRFNWIQQQIDKHRLWLISEGRRPWIIILKYRRGGVTTWAQGLAYHRIWSAPHRLAVTFAHRDKDTRGIFEMVNRFYEHQPEDRRHKKSSADVMRVEFPDWGSTYRADTAGAKGSGRGARLDQAHLSEAAQYPALADMHEALSDALAPDAPYIWESTPFGQHGRGEAFYTAWQIAKRGESEMSPLFFPWHSDPRNVLALREPDELGRLTDQESRLQRRFDLAPEQLKWWRQKRRELMAVGRGASAILQEHPNDDEECFLEGGNPYYDAEAIQECMANCRPPIPPGELLGEYGEMWTWIEKGILRIWEEPRDGQSYVLGCDPAEGVGADASPVVGVNAKTGVQAFTWSWNRIPPDVLGSDIIGKRPNPDRKDPGGLGWIWRSSDSYPAFAVIERINHGHAVLTGMLKVAKYPTDSVYHDIDELRDNPSAVPRAGWRHNHIQLTTVVGRMLREMYPVIYDEEVIRSIRRVELDEKGSAEFGGRDEAVAAGLAAIGLEYAPKLGSLAWVGGMLVDLETGEPVK